MAATFDQSFVGLQINWDDDDEIEYIGRAVLFGSASTALTAASCKKGTGTIHYRYAAKVRREHDRITLTYRDNPMQWEPSWGWDVYHGDLVIELADQRPSRITFFYKSGRPSKTVLMEGDDWIYLSSEEARSLRPVKPRRRVKTTRLERDGQARLRNLLISEHGQCQVTGTRCVSALEACHILPVGNGGRDNLENALLLRRDIHALFDAGLLEFVRRGGVWRVELDPSIDDDIYKGLTGAPLSTYFDSALPYLEARAQLKRTI